MARSLVVAIPNDETRNSNGYYDRHIFNMEDSQITYSDDFSIIVDLRGFKKLGCIFKVQNNTNVEYRILGSSEEKDVYEFDDFDTTNFHVGTIVSETVLPNIRSFEEADLTINPNFIFNAAIIQLRIDPTGSEITDTPEVMTRCLNRDECF